MESVVKDKKKINRLIIVGNGFDVSLGLESRYKDFLYHYLLNSIINIYENVEKFKTKHIDLTNNTYNFSDELIELKVPSDRTSFTIKGEYHTLDNFKKLSKYLLENNILKFKSHLLDKIYHSLHFNNWVDIEVLYYDELVELTSNNKGQPQLESLISNYNNCFNKLRLELVKYLSSIQPPWSIQENHSIYQNKVSHYTDNFFSNMFYIDDGEELVNRVMFLNFNYTPTIKYLTDWYQPPCKYSVNHIHGKLNDKDSVIFGFGFDEDNGYTLLENIRDGNVLRFMKRPYYSGSERYRDLIDFIENDEFEVFILGHSCGVSDKTLLNDIFESNLCKSIRIFYHKREDGSTDRFEKSIELSKHTTQKKLITRKIRIHNEKDDIMWSIKEIK